MLHFYTIQKTLSTKNNQQNPRRIWFKTINPQPQPYNPWSKEECITDCEYRVVNMDCFTKSFVPYLSQSLILLKFNLIDRSFKFRYVFKSVRLVTGQAIYLARYILARTWAFKKRIIMCCYTSFKISFLRQR